jgi:hypothetical protein
MLSAATSNCTVVSTRNIKRESKTVLPRTRTQWFSTSIDQNYPVTAFFYRTRVSIDVT